MKNKWFILCLMLAGSQAFAQQFTLEEAKEYALEHNLSVINANHDATIAQHQITETRGLGLPQVNFEGNFNHFVNLPVQVMDASFFNPMAPPGSTVAFREGTDYSASGSLTVGQLLFNGSYVVGLQASQKFAEFQTTAGNLKKEEVVFQVIQAYELATIAKENLVFVDSMVVVTERMIEQQQVYFDLGLLLPEDIDQLNISLLSAKNAQLSAKLQYDNSINLLKFAMGYPMDDPIETTNTSEELMSKSAVSTGNLSQNIGMDLAERQVVLSELNLRNMKAKSLPSVNAFFSQTYNAYRTEFNFFADQPWYPQTVWGLSVQVPIFSGLTRRAQVRQAEIKLLKDENSRHQMAENLKLQEIQAKNALTGAQSKFDLQKENVELAQRIYQNAADAKEIGKGNAILVTQKYNQLIAAQAQYLSSQIELFQAKLNLDKLYNKLLPNQ